VQPTVDPSSKVDGFRNRLKTRLPGYMVPQQFIALDALPLTPNGKIDRKALQARTGDLPVSESEPEFIEPRTPHERLVADVYADVLALPRVSADGDFFDLGGHSVLAMRTIARLRELGAPQLALRDIFEAPAVAALAARVEALVPDLTSADAPDESRDVLVF
jgi:hypothetical protein